MANNEVKLIITADSTGVVTGVRMANDSLKGLANGSGSLVNTIKNHWLGFSAAVAGAMVTIREAWDLGKMAADFNEQMALLNGLAAQYGTTADTIVDKVKAAGDGMISMSAAAEVSAASLAKGLSVDMVEGIAKASTTLSDFMGMNAEDTFKQLAAGLELGKEKTIKFATGVFDLKERFGEAVDKMTEAEKQTALYTIITEKAAEIQGRVGDQAKSTADKMDTLVATLKDLQLYLGQGILRAAAGAMGAFQGAAAAALWLSGGVFGIIKAIASLSDYAGLTKNAAQEWAIAKEAANNAASELWGKAKDNFAAMAAPAAEFQKAMGASAKGMQTNQGALDKMSDAMQKWKDKTDGLTISLDKTSKEMADLVHEADKLKKEFGDQAWISEGLAKGLSTLLDRQNLESATAIFDTVKDLALRNMEIEKKGLDEQLNSLKEYRSYLVSTYDYAISRAEAYYKETQKIDQLLSHGKDFLSSQASTKLSASEQMAKDKENVQNLVFTANLGRDSDAVSKAMTAIESFMDKYRNNKSVLGFSEDFSGMKDDYQFLVDKLELMKSATEDAGAAWERVAARQVAAIQNVDEWVVYLENEVRSLDVILGQTREIKIDTTMAEAKVRDLTDQIVQLQSLAGSSSGNVQHAIEQNIADNIRNGRSPLNNSGLAVVE